MTLFEDNNVWIARHDLLNSDRFAREFVVEIVAYILTFFFGAYIILPIVFAIHQYQMAKDLNEMLAQERANAPEQIEAPEGAGPDE